MAKYTCPFCLNVNIFPNAEKVERHIITAHPAVAYSLQGAGYYAQKVK